MSTNDDLRELLAKATPGPWEVSAAICGQHHTETVAIYHRDRSKGFDFIHEVVESGCKCGDDAISEANAALIVAAVNALPALLARLDSLAGELDAALFSYGEMAGQMLEQKLRAESAERERDALREALAELADAGEEAWGDRNCVVHARELLAAKPKGEL
jgi:hypothetical protein